jgi:(R,R)-butanediol dehydrogenase / meso-butanediol dehydrogenase / diacetyl reductase
VTARPTLVLTAPETFSVEQREPVEAADGQVAVDVGWVGLCGTDLHIVEGTHPRARFPLVLGHELAGRAVGGNLDGRAVVVDPLIADGTCSACVLGERHVCANLRLIGIDRDGGLSGRVVVEADRVHAVPDGLDLWLAALAEPLAVAVHATRRASVVRGDKVVVVGAGPIGLLLAITSRLAGAAMVLIAERSPARREFAAGLGFEILDEADTIGDLERHTDGWLADVVFDAAAAPAVAALLPRLVRPAGRVSLVGTYSRPVEVDLQAVLFKELTLLGNRVYRPEDIDAAVAILAADPETFRPLITEIVPLDGAAAAFERLRAGVGVKYLVATGAL